MRLKRERLSRRAAHSTSPSLAVASDPEWMDAVGAGTEGGSAVQKHGKEEEVWKGEKRRMPLRDPLYLALKTATGELEEIKNKRSCQSKVRKQREQHIQTLTQP